MSIPAFSFTRVPSIKTRVITQIDSLTTADNDLVLIGLAASSGATATLGAPVYIDSYGDPVAALSECNLKFGTNSQLGEMVVAAINGVLFSNQTNKVYPKIRCIPLVSTATSTDLATALANNLTVPMPYLAVSFPGTDATALTALKNHLTAISGEDRGKNGQFGSFGFLGLDGSTSIATAQGLSGASELLCFPWLRDTAVTKANKIHVVTAAYAALCASVGVPFLPLTDIVVGGLIPPVSISDWHTDGDTGTAALGLSAGVVPLMSKSDGTVAVSRSITSRRPISATEETAYFDLQDWQVLYYFRKSCFVAASQTQFKISKASVQKAEALNSEFIKIAKDFEALEMFQYVDRLVSEFTFTRQVQNRAAFVYQLPVNVIPGFANKGIELVGTTKYDSVVV